MIGHIPHRPVEHADWLDVAVAVAAVVVVVGVACDDAGTRTPSHHCRCCCCFGVDLIIYIRSIVTAVLSTK